MKNTEPRKTLGAKIRELDPKWKGYTLAGCICILFYVVLTNAGLIFSRLKGFFEIIQPITIGVIGAYIANPMAVFIRGKVFRKIKKEKTAWTLSVIVSLLIIIALLTLLVVMLIPQMAESISTLVGKTGNFLTMLKDPGKETILDSFPAFKEMLIDFYPGEGGLLETIGRVLTENIAEILSVTTMVGNTAINWAIGAILVVYFMLAKETIKNGFRKFLQVTMNRKDYADTTNALMQFNDIFSKYIVFELIDALIVGVACYLFMIIAGNPNAALISVICGFTNLIPTFGPVIGAGLGAIILFMVKPESILAFLIFTIVIQAIDGYVIKPKLFGSALNVPGFLILIAVIFFGKTMGIGGMLIAIPVAAFFCFLSKEFYHKLQLDKEKRVYKKELSEETAEKNGK